MTSVLLLAPAADRVLGPFAPQLRVERREAAVVPGATGRYAAVVVLNDHTPESVCRLRAALALREQDTRLRVAVLTFTDGRVDALVRALVAPGRRPSLPLGQAAALMRTEWEPVRADLSAEAISFEYQV